MPHPSNGINSYITRLDWWIEHVWLDCVLIFVSREDLRVEINNLHNLILSSLGGYVITKNTYILLDVLLCSIAEYFYELCSCEDISNTRDRISSHFQTPQILLFTYSIFTEIHLLLDLLSLLSALRSSFLALKSGITVLRQSNKPFEKWTTKW